MIATDLATVLPELLLAGYAMAALMYGVFTGKDETARSLMWMTALVMAALALWIATVPQGRTLAFFESFVDDGFARFAKVVILLSAAAVLVTSEAFLSRQRILRFEYPVLITLSVVGMMIMVSANDLIVLYMGLELQSLALYVIASFQRDSARSTEAGLKYFMLG
ncbi:MAG: NADH-quinone oxidoreductase subunit N, partial [Rhodobacteraceae bacterium]|nr:NADH-quinone oxidoreductase subunit N [Paracoccaceae bacterium]